MHTLMLLILVAMLSGSTSTPPAAQKQPIAINVILFIGDGMCFSTVSAMRIYVCQQLGGTVEKYVLPFETFANKALLKTDHTYQ